VFNNAADFDTEFDSSPVSVIEPPVTGEYLLYIRKKRVKTPRTAQFNLTLAIK
jgi:hypothetical protein